MKEKIKLFSRKYLIGFTIGAILFGSLGVYAATYFPSNQTTYDNTDSGMTATNVQDALDELYTVCVPPKTITDNITDLVNTNSDELYKDEHGNIRYYGADPDNYVSFNNELWRIMGLIDGTIKIIKSTALPIVTQDNGTMIGTGEGFLWNYNPQSGKLFNNWDGSTLQTYLNGTYYNSIDSIYKKMILEGTYYLGGSADTAERFDITAQEYYDLERDNTAIYPGNPASIKQYIGLMYPSDYGYAAGSNCITTALLEFDNCYTNDYLFTGDGEWLQSPSRWDYEDVAYIMGDGSVNLIGLSYRVSLPVRPVLYLNTNVQITGGTGTESNPYTLSV